MEPNDSKSLSVETIKQATGKYDVESVFMLSIADAGVTNVEAVAQCCNLVDLDVHNNSIVDIRPLSSCVKLERINLSNNRISTLEPLQAIPTLSYLHFQGNKIRNLCDLNCLKQLPSLKALYLQNIDGSRPNPVCNAEGYKEYVLALCPALDILDGQRLKLSNDFYKLTAQKSIPTSESPALTSINQPIRKLNLSQVKTDFLNDMCRDLQNELKSCRAMLAEVDMFLRRAG